MDEFELQGQEHQLPYGSLVPIGSHLPYCIELQTRPLLDFLLLRYGKNRSNDPSLRQRFRASLYSRTRPGFHLELSGGLHLAYADQRDGKGSEHWWRLFCDADHRNQLETMTRRSALAVRDVETQAKSRRVAHPASKEWGGMYFRSESEIRIAQELDRRGVLYFANCQGRISANNAPVSAHNPWFTGRLEVDFLVCNQGRWLSLEVDGQHHESGDQIGIDRQRDRLLLKQGIPTVRFSAQDCFQQSEAVVTEFLNLFERVSA